MLLDVLDDEGDVQNMLISRAGVERSAEVIEEDEEEVEGLLEYYLQRSEVSLSTALPAYQRPPSLSTALPAYQRSSQLINGPPSL
eukprot:8834855-Pyramimonas_sp.AAC.1